MGWNFKSDTVVYQIYPRSFMDTDGDGFGDIPGIIGKLDYIRDLGVNTIWLSPIYESPDDDNGYDISNYKAIHPRFGTMEDFDRLVGEARARGIDIVMDLVINHTSDEHEWFKKALAGDEKYRNYYIIREGRNGDVPNNWGNFFAECPWTPFGDTSRGEYYLHLFSKKQPDLNWHNPDVLSEIEDIMRFWLDKGVRGFRCDVINVIYKEALSDGKKRLALTGQEHYLSKAGCHEILKRLRSDVLEKYGAWAVGETVFVDIPKARDLCNKERGELDMVFSFEHMECDQIGVKWFKKRLKPKRLMQTITKWQKGLEWNAVYFENHDQPRFVSRFADSKGYTDEASKMMAGLMMTLRGTPFVYQGQEIGMTNGDFKSLDEIKDIESHNIWQMAKRLHIPRFYRWCMIKRSTRDNARTPMQWDSSEGAGFTSGEPWLQVNANKARINVNNNLRCPDTVLSFWQKMIALRKTDAVLLDGDFKSIYEGKRLYVFERSQGSRKLITVCNMSHRTLPFPSGLLPDGAIRLADSYSEPSDRLRPFEFVLYEQSTL